MQRIYDPEMEALVKAASGAARGVVFDHTLRTADDAAREAGRIREVASRVHNDYTERSSPQRVRDLLPVEADDLLRGRFATCGETGTPSGLLSAPTPDHRWNDPLHFSLREGDRLVQIWPGGADAVGARDIAAC